MSQSDDAAALVDLIKVLTAEVLESYLTLAIAVLLPIYEFIITIDQEAAAVWMRDKGLSLGSLLLVSTRWCMVMTAVLVPVPPSTIESCKAEIIASRFFLCAGFVQVAVFSALRVSAIWGRNWFLFLVVLILGSVPVVPNAFVVTTYTYSFDTGSCILATDLPERTIAIFSFTTRISVIIADVLVLILTWVKTYEQVVHARRSGQKMSVSVCLFRDGTIYFLILLVINVLALYTNRRSTGNSVNSALDLFITSIPPILVNRFMLNLRQIDSKNSTHTIGRLSRFSAPQFHATVASSIFGNFGEPLEHNASLREEGDEGLPADSVTEDVGGELGLEENEDAKLHENEATTSFAGETYRMPSTTHE